MDSAQMVANCLVLTASAAGLIAATSFSDNTLVIKLAKRILIVDLLRQFFFVCSGYEALMLNSPITLGTWAGITYIAEFPLRSFQAMYNTMFIVLYLNVISPKPIQILLSWTKHTHFLMMLDIVYCIIASIITTYGTVYVRSVRKAGFSLFGVPDPTIGSGPTATALRISHTVGACITILMWIRYLYSVRGNVNLNTSTNEAVKRLRIMMFSVTFTLIFRAVVFIVSWSGIDASQRPLRDVIDFISIAPILINVGVLIHVMNFRKRYKQISQNASNSSKEKDIKQSK